MVKKVIKMSATWCMPCKIYSKTFNEVKNEERFKDIIFEELDAEENEDIAIKYGVKSIPTTIMLGEDEKVLFTFSGNVTKKYLETKLDELNA